MSNPTPPRNSAGPAYPSSAAVPGDAGESATAPVYIARPQPPSREKPWTIRYILADLDGTRMPSYSAFHAFELLAKFFHTTLKVQSPSVSLMARQRELSATLRAHVGIEALLHNPEPSLRTLAEHYAQKHAPTLLTNVTAGNFLEQIPGLLTACEASFRLFPGAEEFLIRAKAARTAFGIFTATAPQHAVNRMIRAGENPELINEIWSRSRCKNELEGHFDWQFATPTQRAFVNLLRPYKDSKPHPGPLRAVHEQYELAPDSVLMIGEGSADLGCVMERPECLTADSRLHAYFAFQRQGAEQTEAFAEINDLLRQDHPLGLRCFESLYPGAAEHPGIISLEHGFETLLGMVANGVILLKPTPAPIRESELSISGYRRPPTRPAERKPASLPIEID